jgi:hypothetical protein
MLIPIATKAELENFNPISAIINGGDKIISTISKDDELEKIVKQTFTEKEYTEWLKVYQSFQIKETQEKEKILSCIKKGTNEKTCVDPHWCLYPNQLNKNECSWYRRKYSL